MIVHNIQFAEKKSRKKFTSANIINLSIIKKKCNICTILNLFIYVCSNFENNPRRDKDYKYALPIR